jgi:WD40-like Beta Propeller Repeat
MTPLFQPNQLQPRNPHLYHPNQGAKVQPTGQHTKTPHTATGLFALLCDLLHLSGTGAGGRALNLTPGTGVSPRLTNRTGDGKIRLGNLLIVKQLDYCLGKLICHRLTLALSAALLTLSFGVSAANAAIAHEFLPVPSKVITEGVPAETKVGSEPALTGPISSASAMAADSGHLFVSEHIEFTTTYRTDRFNAVSGAFELQFEQVPGLVEPDSGVAVAEASHGVYVEGAEGIAVYSEAGVLQGIWKAAGLGGGAGRDGVAVDNHKPGPEDWAADDVYAPDPRCVTVKVAKTGAYEDSGCTAPSATKEGEFEIEHAVAVFKPGIKGAKGAEEAPEAAGPPLAGTCASEGETVGGLGCGPGPGELVPFTNPLGVAVSKSTGEVLVLDQREREGGGTRDVVDVFKPAGLSEFVFVRQLTGTPNGGLWEDPGGGLTGEGAVHGVAAGAGGDIYVSEQHRVDQFNSEGVYVGRLSETSAGPFSSVRGVAVDPVSGDLFVGEPGVVDAFGPDLVIPDVTTEPVSGFLIEPSTHTWAVTLNGTVNPIAGAGEATCTFEYGTSTSYGEKARCASDVPAQVSEVVVPVESAPVTKLQPDTTYDYRLDATNVEDKASTHGECPVDCASFTTPGPGIQSTSASDVASTSVTLEASIDPHEEPTTPQKHPTAYFFQYGETAGYGNVSPTATVGPGETATAVQQHIQGLIAGHEYHYRVVAVSEVEVTPGGEIKSEQFDGADHTFTTQAAGGAFSLPDGRQWELVSPPDKHGALIQRIAEPEDDSQGQRGVVQAAADGSAVTYVTQSPTEPGVQGYDNKLQVLSTRGAAGWSTRDIAIPHRNATGAAAGESEGSEYRFFSEDLSLGVVQPFGGFEPALSSEASEQTAYRRTDYAAGSVCVEGCYQPLVTGRGPNANVTSGLPFSITQGEECPAEEGGEPTLTACGPRVRGATPDASHIVLTSAAALTSAPAEDGLYEWSAGAPPGQQLSLISRLPGSEANAPGAVLGISIQKQVSRHAISNDGSRVFFSAGSGGGELYMRDLTRKETIEIGGVGAAFEDANAEGSLVFYSGQECEVRLNKAPTPKLECAFLAKDGAVLGASEDGSWVYYVTGSNELFLAHDGVPRLIAVLSPDDSSDWSLNNLETLTSRVSPDGEWLAFLSDRSLTGYDNRDQSTGRPDQEVYLYDASTSSLVCASCDPTGARPLGSASVPGWTGPDEAMALYQSRYLSDSGRVFFNSDDALVPRDVNGAGDVYEFEPRGLGGCTSATSSGSVLFSAPADGCVGLISSGSSPEASAFLDASESGADVFFLTTSRLSPADSDTLRDVYDAHECSAASPCLPQGATQPPACTTADSCRAAPTPQPEVFGAPSSATFSGQGNVVPPPPPKKVTTKTVKCKRGLVKNKKKKCVKHKKKKTAKKSNRRAK